ncbi:von Willebrand factor A domain-containing protein 1-like [Tachysurus ichikawai]
MFHIKLQFEHQLHQHPAEPPHPSRITSLTVLLTILSAVHNLRLTPMGFNSVKVDWKTQEQGAGLQGYWVKWETVEHSPSSSSSRYLPAHSLSTVLTHLNPTTRVCVSPVYRTAHGEGQCCTTHTHRCFVKREKFPDSRGSFWCAVEEEKTLALVPVG